eukprot:CAMPEP_0175039326 /NCGR_PEP_ID=MMETSP0052_2-20121109/500_1 /TAXON_ID=51329 ORGANISM="Polytomella parva, Strain SAG 63-3" /NCGR_SAMPLE_ID=MMETSP0052_2 /ASSEMBLY_ACC=CAM_ASM_000194 /LENGTH=985 /DNA_ID=CAMNT_0016301123 /DNA_START=252 /DNA_END=3206 /DNA_ORIENTATION=-
MGSAKNCLQKNPSNRHDSQEFFLGLNENKNYTIQEIVGKGSYGVVCSAVDKAFGEEVAIKRIQNVFSNVNDSLRILREIKLLRLLKQEDLVSIKHIMIPTDPRNFKDVYVVFELMETDLHTVIGANDDLTPDHHRIFIYQLLRGINYMHKAGVVHRDLKPKNILANADCKLKICDLGLARPYLPNRGNTPVHWTDYVATRWYRAPELCGCFFGAYTPAVDIWSLGCIFAEILLGRPLFPGTDAVSQLNLITDLLGKPNDDLIGRIPNRRAREFLTNMPAKCEQDFSQRFPGAEPQALEVLRMMLCFDPSKRPSASELLAHDYFKTLPSAAEQPSLSIDLSQEFEFEYAPPLQLNDVRRLIYEEVLNYHPKQQAVYRAAVCEAEHNKELMAAINNAIPCLPPVDGALITYPPTTCILAQAPSAANLSYSNGGSSMMSASTVHGVSQAPSSAAIIAARMSAIVPSSVNGASFLMDNNTGDTSNSGVSIMTGPGNSQGVVAQAQQLAMPQPQQQQLAQAKQVLNGVPLTAAILPPPGFAAIPTFASTTFPPLSQYAHLHDAYSSNATEDLKIQFMLAEQYPNRPASAIPVAPGIDPAPLMVNSLVPTSATVVARTNASGVTNLSIAEPTVNMETNAVSTTSINCMASNNHISSLLSHPPPSTIPTVSSCSSSLMSRCPSCNAPSMQSSCCASASGFASSCTSDLSSRTSSLDPAMGDVMDYFCYRTASAAQYGAYAAAASGRTASRTSLGVVPVTSLNAPDLACTGGGPFVRDSCGNSGNLLPSSNLEGAAAVVMNNGGGPVNNNNNNNNSNNNVSNFNVNNVMMMMMMNGGGGGMSCYVNQMKGGQSLVSNNINHNPINSLHNYNQNVSVDCGPTRPGSSELLGASMSLSAPLSMDNQGSKTESCCGVSSNYHLLSSLDAALSISSAASTGIGSFASTNSDSSISHSYYGNTQTLQSVQSVSPPSSILRDSRREQEKLMESLVNGLR